MQANGVESVHKLRRRRFFNLFHGFQQRIFGSHNVVALHGNRVVAFFHFVVGFDGEGIYFAKSVELPLLIRYFFIQFLSIQTFFWRLIDKVVDWNAELHVHAVADALNLNFEVWKLVFEVVDDDLNVVALPTDAPQFVFHFDDFVLLFVEILLKIRQARLAFPTLFVKRNQLIFNY